MFIDMLQRFTHIEVMMQVIRTVVHEVVDAAMPHLVSSGG
jgi:hypothetical protein